MFEDTLQYKGIAPSDSCHIPSPADLDADARIFYFRMTSDIAVVAADLDRQGERGRISRDVLAALLAGPEKRAAKWRQLHRSVARLLEGRAYHVPVSRFSDLDGSFARLRSFVAENADLTGFTIEPPALTHMLGA
jgi:hypothetical protein